MPFQNLGSQTSLDLKLVHVVDHKGCPFGLVGHGMIIANSRGGYVLLGILGRGVLPSSPNPDSISDQNMPFSTPVFRHGARFSKVPVTYRAR